MMERYAGLDNREIGQVLGGLHYLPPPFLQVSNRSLLDRYLLILTTVLTSAASLRPS
jgi:hypothetical protein